MKIKLPFIDLFAGCGGLSLGLEQAGFTPVYVNELNNDALETYRINRKELPYLADPRFFSNDVAELTKKGMLGQLSLNLKKEFGIKHGELALVVGGPPCQGYSGIGHRRSYKVERKKIPSNYLYKDMAKVIRQLRPKAFVFENVRGLLSARWSAKGKKGEIINDVVKEFSKLKEYFVAPPELLQCKDYGIPQNRPRIFIMGIRKDLDFQLSLGIPSFGLLPEKTDGEYPHPRELLGDLVDYQYSKKFVSKNYRHDPKTQIQFLLRKKKEGNSYYRKGDILTEQEYSRHNEGVVKKFKYMLEHGGQVTRKMKTKKFAQRLIPSKWNGNGPNITATSLPDDYVHFSQPRCLTVREWARLQMFPDWYEFKGKRTTGGIRRAGNPLQGNWDRELPKYTQIGNAVPVELARRIGCNIIKNLKGD